MKLYLFSFQESSVPTKQSDTHGRENNFSIRSISMVMQSKLGLSMLMLIITQSLLSIITGPFGKGRHRRTMREQCSKLICAKVKICDLKFSI